MLPARLRGIDKLPFGRQKTDALILDLSKKRACPPIHSGTGCHSGHLARVSVSMSGAVSMRCGGVTWRRREDD